ncbi:hypothetical protein V8F20_005281 [Naviculisporaceae sp. PSN 640]
MNARSICKNCLRRIAQQPKIKPVQSRHTRTYFSKSASASTPSSFPENTPQIDPSALLSKPTWSIKSLFSSPSEGISISPAQLTHLLRLSALPTPSSPAETQQILSTLQSQLLFVREIQKVDTTGIRPLPAIRDESAAGLEETTLSLDTPSIKDALSPEKEESFGHCKRPRRIRTPISAGEGSEETKDWDVLGTASERAGRYFVVRSKKARGD